MADVRDWGAFVRGRWDWTRGGYEQGFPRRCQFTDVDAAVEFDGHALVIEPKHYDGVGPLPDPYSNIGQLLFLRNEAALGKAVLMLFGCGPCNDPYAVMELAAVRTSDKRHDWRGVEKIERRERLKRLIDVAMGLVRLCETCDRPADTWNALHRLYREGATQCPDCAEADESDWPETAKPGAGVQRDTEG